jgi:hypothetical protein
MIHMRKRCVSVLPPKYISRLGEMGAAGTEYKPYRGYEIGGTARVVSQNDPDSDSWDYPRMHELSTNNLIYNLPIRPFPFLLLLLICDTLDLGHTS